MCVSAGLSVRQVAGVVVGVGHKGSEQNNSHDHAKLAAQAAHDLGRYAVVRRAKRAGRSCVISVSNKERRVFF